MTNALCLPDSMQLFVEGHISREDAERQTRTASMILSRLMHQPGLVLGDEVGMGKTFVALAVAAAHIMRDAASPVVVMVPGGVVSKWQRDAETFREKCLGSDAERSRFRVHVGESGVDFLKELDNPARVRATLIILAHGALHRKLADRWVKLAVLQAAVKRRADAVELRRRLARFGAALIARGKEKPSSSVLEDLLAVAPSTWKPILVQHGVLAPDADDPVPQHFLETLDQIDLGFVHEQIVSHLPARDSPTLRERLQKARHALDGGSNGVLPRVWKSAMQLMKVQMPLLILDEAHRVRHGGTQLAGLLREAKEDLDSAGQLAGRFDRMLFLTATPFQLGHSELLNVLSRFKAVRWKGAHAPTMSRTDFEQSLDSLSSSLDAMQRATERLEQAWKQLVPADLLEAVQHGESWWQHTSLIAMDGSGTSNDRLRRVVLAYTEALACTRTAEAQLRAWVLRSSRSPHLPAPFTHIRRRRRFEGAQVVSFDDSDASTQVSGGIKVRDASALPFLLAARLQTIAEKPRLFSEGISSSFEALLDTQPERDDEAGGLPDGVNEAADSRRADWYLKQLRSAANSESSKGYEAHPKLKATVDRVMKLWRNGEKVLVFCHYRQTGSALHRYLSDAMLQTVESEACRKLNVTLGELPSRMDSISRRLDRGEPAALRTAQIVKDVLAAYPVLAMESFEISITDVMLRFLRTPTFLVRFGGFDNPTAPLDEWVDGLFAATDAAGVSMRRLLEEFATFLSLRSTDVDRNRYLDALKKVQTGSHAGPEVDTSYDDDEVPDAGRSRLVANVRRVYGKTRPETRERIMLTFNTPFYPEILITSRVMAEGVDLHLHCRHVVHHDLDWNPSSLEQRTGRIDRLGSRAERIGKEIHVYLPYVEGCQDEKLFRVVMDRERWFGVVMGAEQALGRVLKASPWEIERMAEEPDVPEALVGSLQLRLAP